VKLLVASILAAVLGTAAVLARPASAPRPFDVARAYALVELQLSYGPRPAGSPAERAVARRLVGMLPHGRFEAVPGGLRNIVGSLPGREPAIVIAAHYDTTPVPGYLGANNSATGVGAVVELARDLEADHPSDPRAIDFVLFDGEEAPVADPTDFYAQGDRGSRAYVSAHPGATKEMILLDFIALHNQVLRRELGSDPGLWARLRTAARSAGAGAMFPTGTQPVEILDDDTPFSRAGVPAIDLIDWGYACWQKTCDDLAQVSERNLAIVGRAVLALLRAERLR
jgi:hypothetical protein